MFRCPICWTANELFSEAVSHHITEHPGDPLRFFQESLAADTGEWKQECLLEFSVVPNEVEGYKIWGNDDDNSVNFTEEADSRTEDSPKKKVRHSDETSLPAEDDGDVDLLLPRLQSVSQKLKEAGILNDILSFINLVDNDIFPLCIL